jgi:type I restriction enzyme R subunit
MRDHGLFQAICRVNRLDGDDKEYGYIVDYKDLFKSLEGAVQDYTSGALDGYDKDDVAGLLENRLEKTREDLEAAREAVKALCEPVDAPKDQGAYFRYFVAVANDDEAEKKANEPKRLSLYKLVASLIRKYANLANEMSEAGYSVTEAKTIKDEVSFYENLRNEIKLKSADYIDLKMYEPAMRYLIDKYIRAEESEKISAFDDMSLIQLIVERGVDAVNALPKGIRKSEEVVAETIENNVRKLIINESPVDPAYYEKISKLLDALIEQRRKGVIEYKKYLADIVALTKEAVMPGGSKNGYPAKVKTQAQRALYNNLNQDETLALAVDAAVQDKLQDDWRSNSGKTKLVRNAIRAVLEQAFNAAQTNGFTGIRQTDGTYSVEAETARILDLVTSQHEY